MKRIRNRIVVGITGRGHERFINLCCKRGMTLTDVTYDEKTDAVMVCMTRKDFLKTKEIRRKCHANVRIIKKADARNFITGHRRNYPLAAAFVLAFLLMHVLGMHVWDIEIDGNHVYTDSTVIGFLSENGVNIGDRISDIDVESLEKTVKDGFDNITWVNVRLEGNILKISMDESKADKIAESREESESIVSLYDGTIAKIITRSGTPRVTVGDEVCAGDILVENVVTVTDDYEENIQIFPVAADADILIRTVVKYSDCLPISEEKKDYTGKTAVSYVLEAGSFKINVGIFQKLGEYTVVESQDSLKVNDRISLPVTITRRVKQEYTSVMHEYGDDEAKSILTEELEVYIKHLQENEVQICGYRANIVQSGGKYIIDADIDAIVPADYDIGEEEVANE